MVGAYLTEDVLVSWLQRFVRFPSQQTALQEADPEVKAFIETCAAPLLEEVGAKMRYDGMGNLIVEAGPADAGRSLMLVGYAMTHPAANMTDPFSATLVDTARGPAVRGRGVAEQKTALTAAVAALAQAIADGRLEGRLVFALTTAGETGRHDAMESVMDALGYAPDQAVILIGTSNRVAIGNKGRVDFDVVVRGKTSHSSAPWNGVNAITGARNVLEALDGLDLKVPDHPAFGPATLTPTALDSAPKATHTVPDTVRITFDRRLLPGEDPETAYRAIADTLDLPPPWAVDCERGPVMYPNEIATDGKLFAGLERAFAKAGQGTPEAFHCSFALDAGYLGRKGVEAVMLGPGEVDQFHSNEEHVLVSDLASMANVYYRLIEECLCAPA